MKFSTFDNLYVLFPEVFPTSIMSSRPGSGGSIDVCFIIGYFVIGCRPDQETSLISCWSYWWIWRGSRRWRVERTLLEILPISRYIRGGWQYLSNANKSNSSNKVVYELDDYATIEDVNTTRYVVWLVPVNITTPIIPPPQLPSLPAFKYIVKVLNPQNQVILTVQNYLMPIYLSTHPLL